jgi:hypothetical protein
VPSGSSVTYCGFGFHLNEANFWKLTGFSVKSANKGTLNGTITGNTFDGTGVGGANSADSWIDAKGNNYQISDNKGTGPSGDLDGYQVHQQVAAFGCGNVFSGNTSKLSSAGFAINVTDQAKCGTNLNVVGAGNTVTGAKSGLSNIKVTG